MKTVLSLLLKALNFNGHGLPETSSGSVCCCSRRRPCPHRLLPDLIPFEFPEMFEK